MKEYLVTMEEATYDNIFIVLATNAKEAIDQVFESKFKWVNDSLIKENEDYGMLINHIYSKSDLEARSIVSLHSERGKIIAVN